MSELQLGDKVQTGMNILHNIIVDITESYANQV